MYRWGNVDKMTLIRIVKMAGRMFDQYSPYPLFYPIIMSKNEEAIFCKKIQFSKNYLEFGLGGSTLRALQKSNAKIYTIESSPEWIETMRKYYIIRKFHGKRLFIHPVDIGPIRKWGYPETDERRNIFPDYSANIFKVVDCEAIDLAFVDGRFRVACTLMIILECHANKNLEIMIHDFWNRKEYHLVLKYLNIINKIDTLGVFSIKRNVDLKAVQTNYNAFKNNPR